jgi:hypothetical protein
MNDKMMISENIDLLFSMQKEFNELISESWSEDRKLADFVYAITDEYAEFLRHTSYEWWKKSTPDVDQAHMEVVDMWFFAISSILLVFKNPNSYNKMLLDVVSQHMKDTLGNRFTGEDFGNIPAAREFGADFVNNMMGIRSSRTKFSQAMGMKRMINSLIKFTYVSGLTNTDLLIKYMGKLQLNIFRQKNGYKTGAYIKMWGDLEDNQVLDDILRKHRPVYHSFGALAFNKIVFEELSKFYKDNVLTTNVLYG